ncbi:hypothetical protein PVK06_007801 [Gossypium arboreum]|uniref:Uncharacterized protein n=1 Tax=Gossypium arboreum TaxID=29729 RepID=A0ABR0QIL7_GOSAR|nr:hypothetical protein PVK06_007801 [Gossypium arboreum]
MVNFSRLIHTRQQLIDKPYVFSSQVKQVFYSKDQTDEGWYIVLHNTPKDLFDMDKMPRRILRDLSIVQNCPDSKETNTEQQIAIGSSNVPNTADEPELSSGQKVGRLQLFDVTHRKKDGSHITYEAAEIMKKLKDKKVEYEAIPSSDSSVNLDDINNRIITEVLGAERYGRVQFQGSFVNPVQYFGSSSQPYMPSGSQGQAEIQRLRDQMAQMQASTVEQIVQLKTELASREAEVQRKYEELQLQLKAEATTKEIEAAVREAEQRKKFDAL